MTLASEDTSQSPRFGFEIRVALALAAGPIVALGFTRFAYALLLPAMRTELGWSFAAAGGINTANAVGYIIGAATAAAWGRRLGAGRAFTVGIAASAAALVLSGLTDQYAALALLRFLGGLSTAVTFVLGSALAARAHRGNSHGHAATLVAIYMAGVGIGIIISGVVVPTALSGWGTDAWPAGWILMGLLAFLLVPAAWWAVRQVPRAGVAPVGSQPTRLRPLVPLFTWYVLFGAGYVSYMTFVIALLEEQEVGMGGSAAFFITLGAASAIATLFVWGRIIARLQRGYAPALISLVVAIGVLPVLLADGMASALVSAVVFGSSFMAGPTAATILARRMLPAHGWTSGIALLTVAFSVGQAIGPLVAGLLSDMDGGIKLGLWLSEVLLLVAGAIALTQRHVEPSAAAHPVNP
jgi:predicted MFS family arabinose efflux permease